MSQVEQNDSKLDAQAAELVRAESGEVDLVSPWAWIVSGVALAWSLFQLWIASPLPFVIGFGMVDGVPARGIHLAFALFLCFIVFGAVKKGGLRKPSPLDVLFAFAGAIAASYLWWNYTGLAQRAGILLQHEIFGVTVPTEVILGGIGILLLLEATRRAIGLPLVVVGLIFLVYSVFGQHMPDLISHKGVSISRLVGYQWLTGEAIFGIPIDVSTRFVYLFVLFGALLDRAGAGQYFIDLAFSLVGRYRGGPAKAAVLASGMTGMISGSSIANTVTTGTFTIPVMKKTGIPAVKAGAFEVAASVNGQIMPPIMGAAAFVMAELLGISYFDVVYHAFVPAVISYIALFYITDLEAQRLRLRPLPEEQIMPTRQIFWRGAHYLPPIALLVYLLIVERLSAGLAVFWSIVGLMAVILAQEIVRALRPGGGGGIAAGVASGLMMIVNGLITGGKNMISVAIAVAAAGIIVGSVASTGLSNSLSAVVEVLAGGNIYILLGLVALLSIVLGMGLPTTANYLVVASLMAPVIVEIGGAAGLILPLIAVHLFVFYYGLMADVTPPVGLASFAAAAISRADPIRTGIQAFAYSVRTAILPFVFVFNLDLLLIGVTSVWHGAMIFMVSLIAILAFTSVTFRWMFTKLNWVEMVILALVTLALFRPGIFMDRIYPPFQEVSAEQMTQGIDAARMRLHVIRETPYGDRRRLFVFDRQGDQRLSWTSLGLEVRPIDGGRLEVVNPGFLSPAQQAGVTFGDHITDIDEAVPDRPAKEWMFIPALLLLALVIVWQRRRARVEREMATDEAAQAAAS